MKHIYRNCSGQNCALAGGHESGGSLGFAWRIRMFELLITGRGVNWVKNVN